MAGSVATCSRPDERPVVAPGPARGAGGSGEVAVATPPASLPAVIEGGPVSSWSDPRVVAGIIERCDFDPHRLKPDEQTQRFGHAFGEAETIDCAGPPPEPAGFYDPCRSESTPPCHDDCVLTCRGCAANCTTTCGLCRGRCGGDEACVRRCAETTASCRQSCGDRRAACASGDCAGAEQQCRERVNAEWVKSGCIDRVEASYLPCVAKCDTPTGTCADRCAAKVKPCDVRLVTSPQWDQLTRLGKRWKKNNCDARCATFGECSKECARGDRVCAEECREAAKPCDWTKCPEGLVGWGALDGERGIPKGRPRLKSGAVNTLSSDEAAAGGGT
ncbi:MAG TPA: hypothetical protein VFS00_34905 [Polyangiaceae bacterium]|nr:hypothetical protein [Polyangiaceae bacterium]